MIRNLLVGLVSVSFLLAGLAIAQAPPGDDPPIRLKKKNKAEAVDKGKEDQPKPAEPPPAKPDEKDPKAKDPKEKPQEDAAPEQPEVDEGEVLNRVGKNMRTSEDRLANREVNDSTRQVQDDIVKDLDSLINQVQNGGGQDNQQDANPEQQQNKDQNQGSDQAKQGNKPQQGGQVKPGMAGRKRGLKEQLQQMRANRGKKPGGQQQAKNGQGNKPQQGNKPGDQQANNGQGNKPQQGNKPGGQQNNPSPVGGGGGHATPGEASKLAEVYKDIWGQLPEGMRAEMNAYSREQFMAKYSDLLKQYYSSVAEKSRKKE